MLSSTTFGSANVAPKFKTTYEETYIEWEIDNFFSASDDKHWKSRSFSFGPGSCVLHLFPKSSRTPEFMALYLENGVPCNYLVEYSFGLKKLDGSFEQLIFGNINGQENFNSNNTCSIVKFEVLQRKWQLTTSDSLTVTCTLKWGAKHLDLDKPKQKELIKLDALSDNFKDLFLNKESCDTTLHVENNEYKAHKAVLIARSSVFAGMFQHDMSEKQTGIVNIPDCDASTFKEFLEFLYCGKLKKIPFDSAFHLYETSDKYNVPELKTFCVEIIKENLTPENFCDIAAFADKHDDATFFSAVQDCFNVNLHDIFLTSEWECLMKNNYRLAHKLLKGMSKR